MYRCTRCGQEFVSETVARGMRFRCPNCRSECEEVRPESGYICQSCGLTCGEGVSDCPACGGRVIVDSKSTAIENDLGSSDERAPCSCKKTIAELLGGYTYLVLVGVWMCALFPFLLIWKNGFGTYNPYIMYPWLVMSVFAAVLLAAYYSGSVKFLKWMFYYCTVYGMLTLFTGMLCIASSSGDAHIMGGAFVWFLLAVIFKKFRRL